MQEQRISLTIPKQLYNDSLGLVNSQLFSDFNEVVKSGLRRELEELAPFVKSSKNKSKRNEAEQWRYIVKIMREKLKAQGGLKKTHEELIEDIRRTREQLFKEKYATHFGQ